MVSNTTDSTTTRSAIFERVWSEPLNMVAADVGLSPNGLAKLCDRLGITRPKRAYWGKPAAEQQRLRPVLPAAPEGVSEIVVLAQSPQKRRARTRMTIDERRAQLLDEAATIVVSEGAGEVTIKRLARDIGISEAQAHNCFARRADLLAALARREIAETERTRRGVISRGTDVDTQIVLSTLNYLSEAQSRGPLLQALLMVPEVRAALRPERKRAQASARAPIMASIVERYGVSEATARGSNTILTAICLRAGNLLANDRISLATAQRLCLPIMLAGSHSNARAPRA